MQIYLILQEEVNLSRLHKQIEKYRIKKWLYIGEDSTWRVKAEFFFKNKIERISIAKILNDVSWEERDKFIEFIGKNSILNDSFEWWSSEISAKNPYDMLYARICLILAFKKYICENTFEDILVICSTKALKSSIQKLCFQQEITIKNIKNISFHKGTQILSLKLKKLYLNTIETFPLYIPFSTGFKYFEKYLSKNLFYRKKIINKIYGETVHSSENRFILIVTWVDRRSVNDKNEYNDIYFKNLPDMLRKKGKNIIYLPQILHTIPFRNAVNILKETTEEFIFPDLYIESSDIKEAIHVSKSFSPSFQGSDSFFEIPITDLLYEFISENHYSHSRNLILKGLIKNMADKGFKPDQIIYPCEGHSWEHALCWAILNYMPDTKIVAYDNVTFSRMVLSMYPYKEEFEIMPLPHRLITNGPIFKDVLLNEGYPEHMIESGCAVRYEDLFNNLNSINSEKWNTKEKKLKIIVATSIGLGDSIELISKAIDAFGNNEKYSLVIKCHPLVDREKVEKFIGDGIYTNNVQFVDKSITDILNDTHILLYTYTAVCFEAISFGVIPVFVRSDNFLNLDKFEFAHELHYTASSYEDLRVIAEKIENLNYIDYQNWLLKSTEILLQALYPVNESCIKKFIITNDNCIN